MMNSEEIIHLATSSYNMKENPLEMDDDSYITMEYTEGSPKAKQMNSILELGKSLLQAAREGDTVKVIELMSKGAPFTTDWLGTSPLHLAAMNNHMDTCETLLRAGIGKDAKTKVDRTPLHFAAYEGHADIVKLLINYNAEVDCKDMLHMTPLHWAVERQHEECAILLIQAGADVTAVSRFHKTPMSIAQEMDWETMLEMLHYANLQRCRESISNTAQAVEGISEDGNNITEDIVIEQETSEQMDGDVHIVDQESETQEHMENILPKVTGSNNEATVQMLREHGIVMLPQDTSNTITSAVQSGRKVVLSDAGKLLLKDIKSSPKDFGFKKKPVVLPIAKGKNTKIFTMSSSQFALALAEQNKQNSSPTKPLNNTEILDNSKYKTLADKFKKLPILKAINLNKTPPKLLSKDGKFISPYKGKIISLNSLTKLPSNLSEELMNVQGKAKIIQLKNASNLGKTVKIVVKNNNNTLNNKMAMVKMENTDKPSTAIQTSTVSTLNIPTLSGIKTFPAKMAPQKDQGDVETLRRELMETKNELEEYKKKFEVLMNELNILKSNQILIKVPDPNHVEHNQTLSGFQLSESVVEESELVTPDMDSG